MSIMANLVNDVWKYLDSESCIRRDINRGLINTRALAKYLIEKHHIEGNLDAVISAIRRYDLEKHEDVFILAHKKLALTASLSTKSNLVNLAFMKDTEIQRLIPKLFEIIKYTRGEVLRIIQADEAIKVLVDEKNIEKIMELIPENKIISIDKNLAEINMHTNPAVKYTPGIVATITNELAINDVNLVEVMTCFPELLWFMDEKYLLKAYHVLYQLCLKKS